MAALTWSLFGLMATVVVALLGLAGVGVTWARDGFRNLRLDMTAGFNSVNERLDATNARVDLTNARIDAITATLTGRIDDANASLSGRIDGLTADMHAGFTAVRGDIAALSSRLTAAEGG